MPDTAEPQERRTVVPRGPPEWGRLEYQEPWAYLRRYPNRWDPLRIAGIVVFGALIVLFALTFALAGEPILAAMYMFPGGLLLVGPVVYAANMRSTVPFRIYSEGLVLPGRRQGRRSSEAELYVSLSDVLHVDVKEDVWEGGPSSFLKVTVLNEYGEREDRIVSLARGVGVAPIEAALERVSPDLSVDVVE